MAMGKRRQEGQGAFWVLKEDLPESPGHPFYDNLNQVLDEAGAASTKSVSTSTTCSAL